jgi:radical SAM protein with 4Fe4S-binding SPASM domain
MYKAVTHSLARVLGTPPYLILFVNDVCWMKCHHCWFNEEWKKEHISPNTLSFDELHRMVQSTKRIHFLSVTGGEAFMRPDIVELMTMFARSTKLSRFQIPTSGFDTDGIVRSTEGILQRNRGLPFRVDVSLDGTRDTHDRIRNLEGAFERATATVRELNGLRSRYPWFDVGVITTLSRDNQDEVEDIAALVEDVNREGEWMVNATRGEPRDHNAGDIDIERYARAHEMIEQRRERGTWKGHGGHVGAQWLTAKNATRRKVIMSMLAGSHRGGGCAAGSLAGVILSDGTVYPCEMLDTSLGNVRDVDYDLRRLWLSRRADEVRAWIQDTRCSCTHECFLSMSLLIQPRHWGDMARERLKLFRSTVRRRLDNGAL